MKLSKEKKLMLAGKYYDAGDPLLCQERLEAKKKCRNFNTLPIENKEKRDEILNNLFGSLSSPVTIEPPFYCDYGYNIFADSNLYMNHGCIILDVNKVTIGKNVLFGPNVQIYTATHPINPDERLSGKEAGYSINIGDNVWIGGGAIICPGISIGNNSVIGAGSVVTKSIPSLVFAAGNPCKVIKKIENNKI